MCWNSLRVVLLFGLLSFAGQSYVLAEDGIDPPRTVVGFHHETITVYAQESAYNGKVLKTKDIDLPVPVAATASNARIKLVIGERELWFNPQDVILNENTALTPIVRCRAVAGGGRGVGGSCE